MKRALIACFLLLFVSCDRAKSPLVATGTGVIQIVVSGDGYGGTAARKLPEGTKKTAAVAGLENLEVRVLRSDNSVLDSRVFTPVDGVFDVAINVEALDNLKVLCIGMKGGSVEYFGLNEDVDVKPDKITIVIIYGWNEPFKPEIGSIKPNPSQDGNFTLSWTQPPNASTYVLQEADNDKFSGVSTVYSGPDLLKSISGKTSGVYYYRVQASNQYTVKSGWSASSSVVVSISQRKYTISGTVTGADGVLVTLSGDASDSVKVNTGGTYTFTVNEKGTYTVSASKAGYFFTPANKTFSAVSSNQIQNFGATQITRTISGVITGADGVLMTLSGDAAGNQVVNNGGTYSFTVPEGGNYTVTPSKEGSAFTPSVGVFTNVRGNITQDFAAALNRATISGIVTGADSVLVTLSGDASEVQTVNDGGTYSFTVSQGKNFTVTLSRTGYVFTPASKTFSAVTVNQKQDFTASKIMRTISGTITGASGVTVTLSGGASDSRVVSADGGSYSFSIPDGGSYTVAAIKSGYTFSPLFKMFAGIAADQTLNFAATRITHTISGTVTGADGVTVTLSGDASGTKTVNSGGSYSFTVGEGGSYTVTPFKSGYVFYPASRTFTNVTADQAQYFSVQAQGIIATDVKMVSIPGGTFQMGDVGIAEPVHAVTLSTFEMSVYEITQGQYKAVIGSNPSYFIGDDNLPVEQVSWWDAIKFCNALSTKAGFSKCYDESTGSCDFSKNGFRLPTEAEWEYACRAGTTTLYNLGDTESDLARAGWYSSNSSSKTHPVGQKTPNMWGLYDMHGNVWEWCNDWYGSYSSGSATNPTGAQSGSYRVQRGGSWGNTGDICRSANHGYINPVSRDSSIGFRVVWREPSSLPSHYTISGLITGADSVTVTLSGGLSGVQTVNNGSKYSFTVESGGEYTVTPSKSGYTFTPVSRTFTNVTADQEQNFIAQVQVITITNVKMVSIPGGTFQMGDEKGDLQWSWLPPSIPVHSVTVSSFQMSEAEITNAQYCDWLNAALFTGEITATSWGVTAKKGVYIGQGYINWSDTSDVNNRCWIMYNNNVFKVVSGYENWPVVYMTWYGSKAFAEYYGWDLPTEAEWEYACRGGKQYLYGTDDGTISKDKANYNQSGLGHPVDVKSYPKNPFGLYDVSGNVYEWCSDWDGSYSSSPATNPTGAETGTTLVIRGGCYISDSEVCRSAIRSTGYPPYQGICQIGFRVVRR